MEQAAKVLRQQAELIEVEQTSAQTAISTQRSESTKGLLLALLDLAEARATSVSERGLERYLASLAAFDLRDVVTATLQLGEEESQEFRGVFPQLGTIIARTRQAQAERTKPKPWVPCGRCTAEGYVFVNAEGVVCDDPSSVPNRRLRECECKTVWRAARDAARLDTAA